MDDDQLLGINPLLLFMATTVYLKDEQATAQLARSFAPLLAHPPHQGGIIYLSGDLGAGKTSFARYLLRALGVSGRIKSPSYALAESYDLGQQNAYHLDFYRFADPREWLDAGFRELFTEPHAILLVEWPERAQDLLPTPDLHIHLQYQEPGRQAQLQAQSRAAQNWLEHLQLSTD